MNIKVVSIFILKLLLINSCSSEKISISDKQAAEKLIPVFPGVTRKFELMKLPFGTVDIGIDYDGKNDIVLLEVENKNQKFKAKRIPGTNMRAVICNAPALNGKLNIKIKTADSLFKTMWVALRIEKSPSDMCSPNRPVKDEYMAGLSDYQSGLTAGFTNGK